MGYPRDDAYRRKLHNEADFCLVGEDCADVVIPTVSRSTGATEGHVRGLNSFMGVCDQEFEDISRRFSRMELYMQNAVVDQQRHWAYADVMTHQYFSYLIPSEVMPAYVPYAPMDPTWPPLKDDESEGGEDDDDGGNDGGAEE